MPKREITKPKRQTNPCVGFYADEDTEYDIRHFTGAFYGRKHVKEWLEGRNDALQPGEEPWAIAWTSETKSAVFMVLRRPRGRS